MTVLEIEVGTHSHLPLPGSSNDARKVLVPQANGAWHRELSYDNNTLRGEARRAAFLLASFNPKLVDPLAEVVKAAERLYIAAEGSSLFLPAGSSVLPDLLTLPKIHIHASGG